MHPLWGPVAVLEVISSSNLPKNEFNLGLGKLRCEYEPVFILALKSLPMPAFAIMQNSTNSSFLANKVWNNEFWVIRLLNRPVKLTWMKIQVKLEMNLFKTFLGILKSNFDQSWKAFLAFSQLKAFYFHFGFYIWYTALSWSSSIQRSLRWQIQILDCSVMLC